MMTAVSCFLGVVLLFLGGFLNCLTMFDFVPIMLMIMLITTPTSGLISGAKPAALPSGSLDRATSAKCGYILQSCGRVYMHIVSPDSHFVLYIFQRGGVRLLLDTP